MYCRVVAALLAVEVLLLQGESLPSPQQRAVVALLARLPQLRAC